MGGCRHRASSSTAAAADDRSFCRFYFQECSSKEMEIPEPFVSRFLRTEPENFRLDSAQGTWKVVTRNDGQSVFFSGGWPAFVEGNTLLTGDFLDFHYVGGSHFEVGVFGLHACRKDADMTRTSGSRASIWASSFKSLATNQDGAGGGVSPINSLLQSCSEKEGSGGYHGPRGAARRRGRRLSSDLVDGISDDGSIGGRGRIRRSIIPPRKRGRRLSSSLVDDSSSDGLNAGTKFHHRSKNHGSSGDDLQNSFEEEGQGYYNGGAQQMRRASLSGSEDDSMHDGYKKSLSETPPPHRPSRGRDEPKPGTARSNKASQIKNRRARLRPEEELRNSLKEKSSDGGGTQRIGRPGASYYSSEDDCSYDGGRGGERRAWRTPPHSHRSGRAGPKSGTLRSNKGTSKFSPQHWAEYHGRGGGVSARLRPEEAQGGSSGVPRWRGRSLSSIDGSSDDGSRSRSRTPPLRPSSDRDGRRAGALKSSRVSTKLPPHSRTKSRSHGGGVSTRLRPEEEWRNSLEDDSSDGGGAQRMERASLSSSEDDISDHGSRGGGKRIPRGSRTHRRLAGVLRPHMAAEKLAPQSRARNHSSSGRPSSRYHPKEELLLSGSEDEGRGGYGRVAQPMGRASRSAYNDDISNDGSRGGYGGASRRMGRASRSEYKDDISRGGYGGVARPMGRASHSDFMDDINNDGSRGGGGGRIPRSRMTPPRHKNGREGGNAGKSGGDFIFID